MHYKEAYNYCIGEEGSSIRGDQLPVALKRHTIMSREFYFVPLGEVDHLTRFELGGVEGIKSHFCFIGATGSEGELQLVERSCYECWSCFDLENKGNCRNHRTTGPLCTQNIKNTTSAAPTTRAASAALMKKVKKHVKANVNIVIRVGQEAGSYVLAKAASKVYPLGDSAEDMALKRLHNWKKGMEVVQVEQYEVENPVDERGNVKFTTSDPLKKDYCLRRTRCRKWLECCGENQEEPCYKRHRSAYLATSIRAPLGFRMAEPLVRVRPPQNKRKASSSGGSKLRYSMPPGLQQQIGNNLDPKGVELVSGT